MQRVKIQLLGPFIVTTAAGEQPQLRRKTRALLAYLVAHDGKLNRQHLIDIFCSEAADPPAVLRSLLSRIRRQVSETLLQAEGTQITIDSRLATVDCRQFSHQLETASNRHDLMETLALYRGEFLSGLGLRQAPAFENWLLTERNHWRARYESGLQRATEMHIAAGDLEAAIETARRWISINPLLEVAHGYLLALYAQAGQLDAARQQYEHCRQILASELAVEPNESLQMLYKDLQAGLLRPDFQLSPEKVLGHAPGVELQVELPLIGRIQPLAQLVKVWQKTCQGQGHTILINAEAGGGKSFLLNAFASSTGGLSAVGSGYESAQSLPYAPWAEISEQLLKRQGAAALADLDDDIKSAIAQIAPANGHFAPGASLPAEQLFGVVERWLGQGEPKLLVLDNLQWLDSASLQLFHYLARRANQLPLLLIGAHRPVRGGSPLATLLADLIHQQTPQIELAPFSTAEIESLADALWPDRKTGLSAKLTATLSEATGGNPLFLTELLRELAKAETIPEQLPLPPSLVTLIQSRLQLLPQASQQVIEALAILQQPGAPEMVRQISGRSENETYLALDEALQDNIIRPVAGSQHQYAFYHDLIRDSILAQVSPLRRTLLHRRTALALGPDVAAATLAHHWRGAGDPEQEQIYCLKAGDQAYEIFANEESLVFLRRALELEESSQGWRLLGRTLERIGQWQKAQAAYERAETVAGDPEEKAAAQRFLGRLCNGQGHYQKSIDYLQQALIYYEKTPESPHIVDIYNSIAVAYYRLGLFDQAIHNYNRSLAQAYRVEDPFGVAAAVGNIGLVHLDMNQLDQAEEKLTESLELFEEMGNRYGVANRLSNLGIIYSRQGKIEAALEAHLAALATDKELGNFEAITRTLGNLATEYHLLGHFQLALEYLTEALLQAQTMQNPYYTAVNLGSLGQIAFEIEDYARAKRWILQAFAVDMEVSHREGIVRRLFTMAQIYFRVGKWQHCHDLCRRALQLIESWQTGELAAALWLMLSHAYFNLAELQAAFAAAERAYERWQKEGQFDLGARILAHKLMVAVRRGDLTVEDAIAELKRSSEKMPGKQLNQAELIAATWRLTGEKAARARAIELLDKHIAEKPHWEARELYRELTGKLPLAPEIGPWPDHLLPNQAISEADMLQLTAQYVEIAENT